MESFSFPQRTLSHNSSPKAAGLSDLHNMGIVHCNLKPSNIFLTPAGDARVADFGFSKVHTLGVAKRRLLPLGYVPEWQPFLGPEALNGRYDSMIDFWALGVTMFQVITGRASSDIVLSG